MCLTKTLTPDQFRVTTGNQFVANAFTLCDFTPNNRLIELGLRDESQRHRVRFLYQSREQTILTTQQSSEEPSEDSQSHSDFNLAAILLLREQIEEQKEDDTKLLPIVEMFDLTTFGKGLYDPQITKNDIYVEITLPGRLTLFFPKSISQISSMKSALSLDYLGKKMRYQIDRIFSTIQSPQILSLELTEVTLEDAQSYPALFPERPAFLQ
jgi:hypothetical protein